MIFIHEKEIKKIIEEQETFILEYRARGVISYFTIYQAAYRSAFLRTKDPKKKKIYKRIADYANDTKIKFISYVATLRAIHVTEKNEFETKQKLVELKETERETLNNVRDVILRELATIRTEEELEELKLYGKVSFFVAKINRHIKRLKELIGKERLKVTIKLVAKTPTLKPLFWTIDVGTVEELNAELKKALQMFRYRWGYMAIGTVKKGKKIDMELQAKLNELEARGKHVVSRINKRGDTVYLMERWKERQWAEIEKGIRIEFETDEDKKRFEEWTRKG